MSSNRRMLERRSLSSPRWSMADSLSIWSAGEGAGHLVWPFELQPVPGAFEYDELVGPVDMAACCLCSVPAEGGILVAPKQDGGHGDGPDVRQPLPGAAARREIRAVVVEGCGEAARSGHRTGEVLDHWTRHGLRVGSDRVRRSQPTVIVCGQHLLGLAFEKKELDVPRTLLLIFVLAARSRDGRRVPD